MADAVITLIPGVAKKFEFEFDDELELSGDAGVRDETAEIIVTDSAGKPAQNLIGTISAAVNSKIVGVMLHPLVDGEDYFVTCFVIGVTSEQKHAKTLEVRSRKQHQGAV